MAKLRYISLLFAVSGFLIFQAPSAVGGALDSWKTNKSVDNNGLLYAAGDPVKSVSEENDSDDDFDDFSEFEDEFADMDQETWDPLEGYNRFMTNVNDLLYINVLDPVAKGYEWLLPERARLGLDRFFINLFFPVRVVNNILQLKLFNAGEETARFAINSTIGFLGFMDPAREWLGLEAHDEDFGQTLGHYGVGAGPHLVVPFFGPSNVRDALSEFGIDSASLHPRSQLDTFGRQFLSIAVEEVNWTSLHLGEYQMLKNNSIEFYIFMRDAYEQKRKKEIEE